MLGLGLWALALGCTVQVEVLEEFLPVFVTLTIL